MSPSDQSFRLGSEMPGGKRSQRVSRRDIEVLGFIARFGVVPRSAVSIWAETGQTATLGRERRLREAGLLDVRCVVWGEDKLVIATPAGLRASGHQELGRARLSLAAIRHDNVVAVLAARLERDGQHVLSEREIAARERVEGRRLLSARLGGDRFHRCDLIDATEDASAPVAIEVELTAKGAKRLDRLLRAWRRAVAEGRFSRVVYRCPAATRPVVQRAVERTRATAAVRVESL